MIRRSLRPKRDGFWACKSACSAHLIHASRSFGDSDVGMMDIAHSKSGSASDADDVRALHLGESVTVPDGCDEGCRGTGVDLGGCEGVHHPITNPAEAPFRG